MTTIPSPLERTRMSLHAVAEHVLGAALHAATGRIGLRAAPGGFATPYFPVVDGQRRVGVDGTDLVVSDGGTERRSPLTTIGAAAALLGIRPGAPVDVYTPSTPLELDRPLDLDLASAHLLAAFFAATDDSLARLATAAAADAGGEPAVAQLWPEHLDLALTIDEVNYGGSPGDDEHALPYLYVGPWTPPTDGDPFWNEPFGASTTVASNLDPATALAFFADGRRRLGR